jgi:2-polyprenyl-6-methoxyphenol hydroxylase-like FAD-dependent oxidoreductase
LSLLLELEARLQHKTCDASSHLRGRNRRLDGLTLAWCLERRGHDPIVVERAPRVRDDGYMIDFFGSGVVTAASRTPPGPRIDSLPSESPDVREPAWEERFSVPYTPLRKRLFNNRHFNFMRGELERVLYQRFTGRAAIRFDTSVAAFAETERWPSP